MSGLVCSFVSHIRSFMRSHVGLTLFLGVLTGYLEATQHGKASYYVGIYTAESTGLPDKIALFLPINIPDERPPLGQYNECFT
jgi:hypothetical protein